MEWSEAGGLKLFRECPNPNGNLLDLEGRLLTCQHGARNIVRTERGGTEKGDTVTVLVDRFGEKRFNSPNDLAVKSDGTIWFTDPPWGLRGGTEGKEIDGHWVFRFDPKSGEVTPVIRDRAMPNGIAFSPDGKQLYVSDTGGHRFHPTLRDRPATVTAYAVDEKTNGLQEKPVWQIETRCDGMCVDVRGRIYTTGPKAVNVWSPDGKPVMSIPVPEGPANVCFGGEEFDTLFITARTSLYAVKLGVQGARVVKRERGGG
ncbi:MAG: SMP-30/gluconolactonase/LRE family protein [Planctomycetota bacterium]